MRSITRSAWHELLTEAHAWYSCPDEISPRVLQDFCLSWISVKERAFYEELQTERLRHAYLAARALCRATLSRYTGVEPSDWIFGKGLHGKPKIVGPTEFQSLRFNLAHTSGLVICVVSRVGEVGVDAEETSRAVDVAQVARHFLSCREETRLKELPAHERLPTFFEQWVLREAYLKGIGTGLLTKPERFAIEFNADGQPLPIGEWKLFVFRPSASHLGAVAVRPRWRANNVSLRWFKADRLFKPFQVGEISRPEPTR